MTISSIGVCGVGMVGNCVKKWFEQFPEYTVLAYTPHGKYNSWEELVTADIFFVAVPTPYKEGGEYDTTILDETIAKLPDGKPIVIKSTVSPGTTDFYQQKYPNKIFLFNPEFLTELTAWEDFVHPDMQILGVPYQSYEIANQVMQMLPRSPIMKIVSPIDAEWIKKFRNAFYATKVIFFNELYDLISHSGADYETVRNTVVEDPKIGNSHSFIFHKNYRGFGGKCLPKDLYSLIGYAERMGIGVELLEIVKRLNKKLLKEQNLKDSA